MKCIFLYVFTIFTSLSIMGMEVNIQITVKAYKGIVIALKNTDKATIKKNVTITNQKPEVKYSTISTHIRPFTMVQNPKKHVSDVEHWAKEANLISPQDSLCMFYIKNNTADPITKSIKKNTSLKKMYNKYDSLFFIPRSNVELIRTLPAEDQRTIHYILWHKCNKKIMEK